MKARVEGRGGKGQRVRDIVLGTLLYVQIEIVVRTEENCTRFADR